MKIKPLVLAALLASLAVSALAEEGPREQVQSTRIVPHDGAVQVGDRFFRPGAMASIKDAPYSAQMVTERQQNLPDGNQIAHRQTSMAYRDSAGRTRQEVIDTKGEPKLVTIQDPAAGAIWILKPQDRSATKIAHRGHAPSVAALNAAAAARMSAEGRRKADDEIRARVEQMRKDGALPAVERHKLGDGKEEIIVKRVVRVDGANPNTAENVRIALETGLNSQRDLQTRLAPLAAGALGDMKWASKATTKDLGTRDFNGIKAEGKLRSYEIPAGEIGNRNPIVVSDETWFAPDLQVIVYTRHSDPRSGDTVFRLDNLKREEPAASLFQVPSDYTVKDPLAK